MKNFSFWYSYFGAIRSSPIQIELFRMMEEAPLNKIQKSELVDSLLNKGYSPKLVLSVIDLFSCDPIIQYNLDLSELEVYYVLTDHGKDLFSYMKKEAPYQLGEIGVGIKRTGRDRYRLRLWKTCSISPQYREELFSLGFKEYCPAQFRISGNKEEILHKLENLLISFTPRGKEKISPDWDSYLYLLGRYGTPYHAEMGNYSYFILPGNQRFSFNEEEISFLYQILEKTKRPVGWGGKPLYLEEFLKSYGEDREKVEKMFFDMVKNSFIRYIPSKDYYSLTSEGLYRINFLKKAQSKTLIGLDSKIQKVAEDKFEVSFSNSSILPIDLKERLLKYTAEKNKEVPFIKIANLPSKEVLKVYKELARVL